MGYVETRVRFPSPAPLIIKDLRKSAGKVQENSVVLMLDFRGSRSMVARKVEPAARVFSSKVFHSSLPPRVFWHVVNPGRSPLWLSALLWKAGVVFNLK